MKLVKAIYSDIHFVSEILEDLGDSLKLRLLPEWQDKLQNGSELFILPKSMIDCECFEYIDIFGVQMSLFD